LLLPLPLALIGLALTIFYAVIGVAALARGFRPARFFLVAWTAVILGSAIYIFMFLRWLPLNSFTYNAAQIGSAVECILLAFALADRVNLLKQKKDEKQSQYTRELREQVTQRTEELTTAVEKLKTASITDPLTGLSNRRHVDAAIQPWIAELQRARIRNSTGVPKRYLALCLADLDHFKLINDELGHAVGDRVLQAAADTLTQNVRATAILARWGGEEFLVLDHVTGPQEDLLMAERLRLAILDECQPIFLEIGRSVTLSLGVVRYPFSAAYPELLTWDHCLAMADHALYRAKKEGRNCWRCYRPNEDALRQAVQELGMEEVSRLLRTHTAQAFEMGLIEVVGQVSSDVQVC
jgi:diguanylate cyclase